MSDYPAFPWAIAPHDRENARRAVQDRYKAVINWHRQFNPRDPDQVVQVLKQCMDPVTGFEFWCDRFVYTFDPRDLSTPSKPFILYECQREAARVFIKAIREGGVVHMDKSRDMGATWLSMAVIAWHFLFQEEFQAIIGSRKEDLVDDRSINSLMGKLDFIFSRLPPWQLRGFDVMSKRCRRSLMMQHPEGALISGESANENFARGARANVVYLDEFAFWEADRQVWTSVSDTAPCRIVTSTPCGEHNQFAAIRLDPGVTRVTLHWSAHPFKDEKWYESEKRLRGADSVGIAQELDIDYAASAGGLALPQLSDDRTLRTITSPRPLSDAENKAARYFMSMDWGATNPTSITVYRVIKLKEQERAATPSPRDIAAQYNIDVLWEYYEPSTLEKASNAIVLCPYYNLVEKIYADPSMWAENQHSTHGVNSLAYLFKEHYGIRLTPGKRGDMTALEQVKLLIEYDRLRVSPSCTNWLKEHKGLRYQTQSAQMARKRNEPEKLVDRDNHSWDNFKYFINSEFDAPLPDAQAPALTGYAALNQEFKGLKQRTIERQLKTPPWKRRRHVRMFLQ